MTVDSVDRKLRVALGVLCGTTGGPGTYGQRLAEALAVRDDVALTVVTDRGAAFGGVAAEVVEVPMGGGVDRLRWQWWALPRALRGLACDVYHDTKNALPRGLAVPAVVTVHDLAYYRCPETFGALSRWFLRRATADAVRRADRVVVPSEATAADVVDVFPHAAAKTVVVHHGIDMARQCSAEEVAEVRARHGIEAPYVLHVGTVQARKNVDWVVRAVRAVRRAGLPHRCVVVGRRGWLAEAALAEIERDEGAVWLGAVSDEDLAALYAGAAAFVSPSAYEGFGFTVADALAAGVPTVVSPLSSLPEVVGDAAVVLPALTEEALVAALVGLLRDEGRQAELRAAGPARTATFTWRRAAEATVAAYRACVVSR